MIAEDEEEHGEAQDQSDLKRVAFSSFEWQSKAHQVSQQYQSAGQDQGHKSTEGVNRQSDLFKDKSDLLINNYGLFP